MSAVKPAGPEEKGFPVYVIHTKTDDVEKLYLCGTGEPGKFRLDEDPMGAAGWKDKETAEAMAQDARKQTSHEFFVEERIVTELTRPKNNAKKKAEEREKEITEKKKRSQRSHAEMRRILREKLKEKADARR